MPGVPECLAGNTGRPGSPALVPRGCRVLCWLWLGVLIPLAILGVMASRAWRGIERDGDLSGNLEKRKSHWNVQDLR